MFYLVIRNDPLMNEPSSSRPSQPVSGDDPNMEETASGEMFLCYRSMDSDVEKTFIRVLI